MPKKTSLLSLSSRLYHVIMKLKCKARRYLSLFSCNSESHMTNYFSFKLSTDVEKNPGPTQSNTDSHETIIKPVMQSDSSIMQLVSLVILMRSRLYELVYRQKMLEVQVTVSLDLYHINYMAIATIICKSVLLEFNI